MLIAEVKAVLLRIFDQLEPQVLVARHIFRPNMSPQSKLTDDICRSFGQQLASLSEEIDLSLCCFCFFELLLEHFLHFLFF